MSEQISTQEKDPQACVLKKLKEFWKDWEVNVEDRQNTAIHVYAVGYVLHNLISSVYGGELPKDIKDAILMVCLAHDIGKRDEEFMDKVLNADYGDAARRDNPEIKQTIPRHVIMGYANLNFFVIGGDNEFNNLPEGTKQLLLAGIYLHHQIHREKGYPSQEEISNIPDLPYKELLASVATKIQEIASRTDSRGDLISKKDLDNLFSISKETVQNSQNNDLLVDSLARFCILLNLVDIVSSVSRGDQQKQSSDTLKLDLRRLDEQKVLDKSNQPQAVSSDIIEGFKKLVEGAFTNNTISLKDVLLAMNSNESG